MKSNWLKASSSNDRWRMGEIIQKASSSYLHVRYTKETFEEALQWTKKAGLSCLYNHNPFLSWGHFVVHEKLSLNGDKGFKDLVDKARSCGIDMGFHTLSNFINTNDEYVTPIPHEHLLVMDTTELTTDITPDDTVLPIADENNFGTKCSLDVVRIGKELIRYSGYEKADGKLQLTGCIRGAYGTIAAYHSSADKVDRLWDHGYKTLFPDVVLQNEMAKRLGELSRYAGISRMSFDGMEGCDYLGLGQYGSAEYVRRCYEIWGSRVLSDASTLSHYRWHAHSYFNWGEPFYESARRSGMVLCRAENQKMYARNLLPHMLGQYKIDLQQGRVEATSLEDFEFCMSQSIAYDAGFSLYYNEEVDKGHGLGGKFLDTVRIWNAMRMEGTIPDELREEMKDINANWHLEETADGWDVYKLYIREQTIPYMTTYNKDEDEDDSYG